MDPFAVLPTELAARVLMCVIERVDPLHRPAHLRTPLLVSRQWNALSMQPELWQDVDLSPSLRSKRHSRPVNDLERLLGRARGGLRTLRWTGTTSDILTSSLWNGAIQSACANSGGLETVYFDCEYPDEKEETPAESITRIADAVGSPALQSFHVRGAASSAFKGVVREILKRSLSLRELCFDLYEGFITTNDSWLPLPPLHAKGIQPLESLEILEIGDASPELWEYLSRMGVKLKAVTLLEGYGEDEDLSPALLANILDVVGGLQLLDFSHHAFKMGMPPNGRILQAVAQYPRRSLALSNKPVSEGVRMAMNQISTNRLESLSIYCFRNDPAKCILAQPLPCLRNLFLIFVNLDDATLAGAIRAASQTLESLYLETYAVDKYRTAVDLTVSAIGAAQSLQRLSLYSDHFSYAMLEPILIGFPPSQSPLCPRIRIADIGCAGKRGESEDFHERLRKSMLDRGFLDGIVAHQPVCKPAVF
jgi:hypothetical protein